MQSEHQRCVWLALALAVAPLTAAQWEWYARSRDLEPMAKVKNAKKTSLRG